MSDGLIINMRAEALLARLAGTQERLRTDLRKVIERRTIMVQSAVKESKLTGQALHVRTGTLRRSINRKIDETASGITATVGTNVRYAALHEYGFTGATTVKAHVRRAAAQMAAKRSKRVGKAAGSINVREHVRQMNMPARSFLRSTLAEQADAIKSELRATILAAVRP